MNAAFLFLLATLALWIGWFAVVRGFILAVRGQIARGGQWAVVGAFLATVGTVFPKDLGREPPSGTWIPIVWLYTPIAGWVTIISGVLLVMYGVQSRTALTDNERYGKLVRVGICLAALIGGLFWMAKDSSQIWILRGAVEINVQKVLTVVALALAAIVVMTAVERSARAKGLTKAVGTHLVLLAGTVLFGIPFAWMLSTSFKESRDLASSDGLVWIPKVQNTHPYFDPDNPQFEARYDGKAVRVKISSTISDGRYLVEVERPYGLRGRQFEASDEELNEVARDQLVFEGALNDRPVTAFVVQEQDAGMKLLEVLTPSELKGQRFEEATEKLEPVREDGLRWQNYSESLEWMPQETNYGMRYLTNTLWLVVMSVIGTVMSCAVVAYGFARLRFPGRNALFALMLSTMMLPAAVTLLPQFLIFRTLGWIDTLLPLWVPTFFAGAFNVFLLRQFFASVPMELEEAARIDGCGYLRTFWQVMLPQVKPALAVIAIWTFMGAWNNFMGPLIYITSPDKMTLSYALQLFFTDKSGEPALMMAFSTMTVVPILLLFFFAQRYFIEGVQLSGLGGR